MITQLATATSLDHVLTWACERGKEVAPLTLEETISYALAYARCGVRVVVLPPGRKRPEADWRTDDHRAEDGDDQRAGWYLGTTDTARLGDYIMTAWRTSGRRVPNLGMQLGVSGLIVVDADNEGDGIYWGTYYDRRDRDLPHWATVQSPGARDQNGNWAHRDGTHWWYSVPAGVDSSGFHPVSEKLINGGKLLDDDGTPLVDNPPRSGWEIKYGASGVLLPLAERPEGRYTVLTPRVPVAPDWLIDLLTTKPAATASKAAYEPDDDDLEVDETLDEVSWAEIVHPAMLPDGVDACGCERFRRPGGSPKSAVAHNHCDQVDAHVLTIHSDTVRSDYPELAEWASARGGRSVTKWEALAAFQFGGSLAAVAEHYGFSRPLPKGQSWEPPITPNLCAPAPVLSEHTDACPHGIPLKMCVPCLAAKRAANRLPDPIKDMK